MTVAVSIKHNPVSCVQAHGGAPMECNTPQKTSYHNKVSLTGFARLKNLAGLRILLVDALRAVLSGLVEAVSCVQEPATPIFLRVARFGRGFSDLP